MRIAWIGPMPNNGGGATGVARQILLELSALGIEVDCFFPGNLASLPEVLAKAPHLKFFCQASSWQWNRWYSRNNYMAFITGQIANLRCEMKLAQTLVSRHKTKPYDLVYQFSHIELHALRRFKSQLPPIVLHPSVHAAGELRWHRKEAHLAKGSESLITRAGVRLMLTVRAFEQKRHIRDADYILSLSKSFAKEISEDYSLSSERVSHIVPNPIDMVRFSPRPGNSKYRTDGRVTFLFVSRISVRKGVEMIVDLSHRLNDISDKVRIMVVGNHTLWSDYRGLLQNLNANVATYFKQLPGEEMSTLYNSVDALIQPSHYEPFGLTVGEALACGIPVISSDKVGAAEGVEEQCCRVFPAGNIDELEKQVRLLLDDLTSGKRDEIACVARSEAERLYSNAVIAGKLVSKFNEIMRFKSNTNEKNLVDTKYAKVNQ